MTLYLLGPPHIISTESFGAQSLSTLTKALQYCFLVLVYDTTTSKSLFAVDKQIFLPVKAAKCLSLVNPVVHMVTNAMLSAF